MRLTTETEKKAHKTHSFFYMVVQHVRKWQRALFCLSEITQGVLARKLLLHWNQESRDSQIFILIGNYNSNSFIWTKTLQ